MPNARGGSVKGELHFRNGFRLCVREVVRFDQEPPQLSRYGYEVWREDEKLYWYDSQAHPQRGRGACPEQPVLSKVEG